MNRLIENYYEKQEQINEYLKSQEIDSNNN